MSFQVVVDAVTRTITDIIDYIPKLVYGVIVLAIGYLVARLVGWLLGALLRRLQFDALMERAGFGNLLRSLGVRVTMSKLLAQIIFLLLLLSFLITATRLMELEPVARLLEQLFFFLPSMIASLIVFMLGSLAARFVGGLVATAVGSAGLTYGERVGRVVQYLVTLFVVVLALAVLGVDTGILTTAVTIMIGAFGLALGLALGLGARSIVHHVLAGYYLRQRFPSGRTIEFGQTRGEVSGIGSINAVVATPSGDVVIPNALLAESVVSSPVAPTPEAPAPGPAPTPPA